MDRRKKILVVVAVLGAGAALALEFRRVPSDGSASSPVPAQPEVESAATAQRSDPPTTQQPVLKRQTTFDGNIEPTGDDSLFKARSAMLGGLEATVDPTVQRSSAPMVDLNAPEQTHTIVDGDTLPNLAQRYMGRADRYVELYQHNRDVLKSPDLLPIGAELRIPSPVAPRLDDVISNPTDSAPVPPTSPASATSAAPVPLAPLPHNAAVSASPPQRPSPRTYTVQPGDTLVEIARKLYGDGRRNQSLFEANRRVMRTPTDLKPGMVLVAP